jgi:hypothetical protein
MKTMKKKTSYSSWLISVWFWLVQVRSYGAGDKRAGFSE